MRKFTTIILFLLSIHLQAQDFTLLKSYNGIEVKYKITKTKEDDKKASWTIEIEYVNKSGADYFYKAYKDPDRDDPINFFATVVNSNAKAISWNDDKYQGLVGDATKLKTTSNEQIFKIAKNKTYSYSMAFRADKGVEPALILKSNNNIELLNNVADFL